MPCLWTDHGCLSTHDLTRRSTRETGIQQGGEITFNSRPHKEVDGEGIAFKTAEQTFNSRPHKEVDSRNILDRQGCFPLSTHDLTRRSTFSGVLSFQLFCLSTHDLTRRSTIICVHEIDADILSTHDLTRRSTYGSIGGLLSMRLSTHDLTRRSTADFSQSSQRC